MKDLSIVIALALATSTVAAAGSHRTRGYIKKNGAYVQPHRATNPNKTKRDNFSSNGNTNPYSGKSGRKDPEK